ncbi:ATP-binding protein [Amycolatopsis pithecellobii]|uniref:AAA family ATPase n=1 Tax=Amycolatopsis pithecellobii TaxID=664692 RepID=A0A6N7YXQ7_9PSEU|nr:AAA family ATPase [Amycolatopsis pithecellobii]MTD53129.1 AAA family ATPase [Amycolatopsis pithecellobii]
MLRVSVLGEQAIVDDATGGVVTRSPRTIALIAFLVLHAGYPQPRQRISQLFWPDSRDGQALTNLRRELHHLRGILRDEPSLVVTSQDLCWHDTGTSRVDLRVFDRERQAAAQATDDDAIQRHAANAIAEYRGEFLPGRYDDWVLEARTQLAGQCADLCDLLCAVRTRAGDLPGAVAAARFRTHLRPLEEAGYRTLMELQARLGDRAGAVSTYHHCASILEQELGVSPDRETREVIERLLARPAEVAAPRVPAGRSGPAATNLIGRSRELDRLHRLWRTAAAGKPALAVVHGGAGVGKTRLLAEIAGAARSRGAVVARAQCFGSSGRLPLAPVADWLRLPKVQSGTAALDPVWRREVERLVPSGTSHGDPDAPAPTMADGWQRHRFFEGLARALIGVGRPMLLIVENLQWCDQETLAFLSFYLGLDHRAPVLVAATLRAENAEAEPELGEWLSAMRATGLLTELSLSPLDIDGTAQLAEAISGRRLSNEDTKLLHATTGGFPLYVVEAMRTSVELGSAGPPAGQLRGALRNRLAQAPPAARQVVELAAAVGRDFTLDLLTEASDLDADTVVQAVDELWRLRIIREFRDGYDFSHDLLRETAYAQISPPKRWLLHRRLAQGLELLHEDTDAVSAQLAAQYANGGQPARAVAYYRRAAELATNTFAHAEAIRLNKAALAIVRAQPDRRETFEQELAILEALAAPLNARYGYASTELQHTLERTVELAETLGRNDSLVTGLIGLWTSRFVQGHIADSHRGAGQALALVTPGSEPSGSAHFAYAGSSLSLGRPAEALRHFELAAERNQSRHLLTVGTRPDVHGTAWAAHAHWLLGDDASASSSATAAITLARTIEHPYSLAVALAYGAITCQLRHDLPALRETVAELRELCERYGFAYYPEWGLILDGWASGDGSGIALARNGIGNLEAQGSLARMPYWLSLLADLQLVDGRPGEARATLDKALTGARARDDLWWLPEVSRMRAGHDDHDTAARRLHEAAGLARSQGSTALVERCTRDLARLGVRPPG